MGFTARIERINAPSKLARYLSGIGLIDLPLRTAFSPAHPLARRDVPLARARAFQFAKPRFREWPRLPFTARIERAQFHRARSASKKGTWPLPPHPFKAARCASTEDHQPPPLLCSASKKDSLATPYLFPIFASSAK